MRAVALLAAGLLVALSAGTAAADPAPDPTPEPTSEAFELSDERINESSGLTASNEHEGTYYTINDSDNDAYVFAIDGQSGEVQAALRFRQIENRDWEAIAAGPDGRVWIGDIGDNEREQETISLFRFREPEELEDQRMRYVRYRFEYADGPHDAEALLIHPKTGRVYVVTKGLGGAAIYEGPEELSTSSPNELKRFADAPAAVTDGAFVPDGSQAVLRTYHAAYVYNWGSKPKLDHKISLPSQPQGESLAVSTDGERVLVGSEGEGSQVYAVSLAAAAPSPTPKPTATPEPTAEPGAEGANDAGTDESVLGGLPWWIPVLVLVIALVAGAAAYPARRPPAPIRPRPAPEPPPDLGADPYREQKPVRPLFREDRPPIYRDEPPEPVGQPLYRDDPYESHEEPPPRVQRPLFRDDPLDEPPEQDPFYRPDAYRPDPYRVEPPEREPYRDPYPDEGRDPYR